MDVSDATLNRYINYLISHIKDDPSVNKLLGKKQFAPSQVKFATIIAFDRIDKTPPVLGRLNAEAYPIYLAIKAGVIQLMETAQIVDIRNSLDYQDGAMTVKDTHEGMYAQLLQYYGTFVRDLVAWKQQVNIERTMSPMNGV